MLFKAAWEMVGDGFGQRQQIYERYHAGDPFRIAASHYRNFDSNNEYEIIDKILFESENYELS